MVTETQKKTQTLIKVSPETKKRLDSLGAKNDTYNDIVERLLNQNDRLKSN